MTNLLKASGLVQGYGTKTVLDGIDFVARPGVTGLLGPNGAGKTTLLRTLATAEPVRAGALTVAGRDATVPRELPSIRRELGFLPQEFGYPKGFTVREFVDYSAWLRGVRSEDRSRLVREALEATAMSDSASTKMSRLSGGMRQRAGIAATIAGDPKVVILDEPTVGLDPMQRIGFREIMTSIPARFEAVVLLSTHLVEDVGACCDEVAVMRSGEIVHSGPVKDFAEVAEAEAPGATDLERAYATVLGAAEEVRR
ncbi:ATP-binding cassette domain-containing protein [Glycomyces sp. L485]|uniref:ATP-binding cassette domain-containing protein n=1 Tax=Glycomyces sp. L485 TaxID=2909235 RepID=UPI001F4BBED5|nr:ATP-binding cassette domain-containing protein [Glycomyces sp. L485]MCH7230619.1 ATP-binding cassette domain-containing protein [Glycomyces sp. L485]